MLKFSVLLIALLSLTTLNAREAYEKEFIHLVNEKVKDGNITSVSNVDCKGGDCYVEGLVYDNVDMESGEKNTISIATFRLKSVKNFIDFKEGRGVLKEGATRQFALELSDIRSDGHNLFFDKEKMAIELGKKSELYSYFKKYLDTPTDGSYSLTIEKQKSNVLMHDKGKISTGTFAFTVKSSYTIKGGFEKLDEMSETNPMGMLSYIVINSIDIDIDNPKGFLKNLMYINYKEAMGVASSKEERIGINDSFLLSGEKVHSDKEFTGVIQKSSADKIKKMAQDDPSFNELLNKGGQFEKKLKAVLAGTSSHIRIKIANPNGLSLGDFFTIFMGYAMQQKMAVKPDITVSIK